MKEYFVLCMEEPIDWSKIEHLRIDEYPWYKKGLKQNTEVRMVRTRDSVIINVIAEDIHSSASVLEQNGNVYLDSCFEFFFSPVTEISHRYINLEVNCIGTVYLALNFQGLKLLASQDDINCIHVESCLEKGIPKMPSGKDKVWCLTIKIPFSFIARFWGEYSQERWFCNFYRCGGVVEDQYAVWNTVVTKKPDFHQPLQFGLLNFVNEVQ